MSAPDHRPLHGFRTHACVDWIELLVTLPAPSQFRYIQARAPAHWGKVFVNAVDGDASSKRFQLRIQNPGPSAQVFHELQRLSAHGPILAENVAIAGLEIAVDFIPTTTGHHDLAHAVAYLHEHLAKPPDSQHRLLHQGRYQAAARRATIVAALREGHSLSIGTKDADDCVRLYVKDYDTRHGLSYAPLPPELHRARMERTLRQAACPFVTLADWRAFRFETLAEHFAMVLPTQDATPLTTAMRAAWGPTLGRPDDPKKRSGHRRQSARATRRDTPLNEKIRQALRDLSKRTATAESAGIRGVA